MKSETNAKKQACITLKSIKKAGRRVSAKLLTAAAIGTMIPYRLEKCRDGENGDDGYALSSLLFRVEIVPKHEDSLTGKTLLSLNLRPMKEVREDIRRFETFCSKKEKTIVEPPAPLEEKDEKKLKKAEKALRKLEIKIAKKRRKQAQKAAKAEEASAKL